MSEPSEPPVTPANPATSVFPAPVAAPTNSRSCAPVPGFVRPARSADLPGLALAHAESMLASLTAGHDGPLPAEVREAVSVPVLERGWQTAVSAPPSPEHHVLVATEAEAVVGLAAVAPSPELDAAGTVRAGGDKAVEVTALGVRPQQQRRGHGSRLLAACADHARAAGARILVIWVVRGDESLARTLSAAGLAPTGAHRQLPVGTGVTEECWAAAL
ncbi:Acetyltransferase (GNAT) family [Actinomyces bovis]|uniref:Acetyltransferase (GNAT) family n=1 Tax=Actinomyces bovis TaxID=1658 RepID=A0ABY1VL24_9ACTO|nr:GNAT family N-acetyltransferase [Actinomyces bovis]SPT52614.1 Acetyltransferase (GNAT) family [Actinomyces bovis]VEG54442.1 Acetyltransferase (GNAT) family [Actinomyces israelii]